MTDTTHKAPQRIWLTRDETYWQNGLGIVFTFQNGSHDVEYVQADRIEELEAKLAKAVEGLEKAKGFYQVTHIHAALDDTLAELTGGNDE